MRHRGTIGGSLSHADPAGDLPSVVLAYDAELIATGPGGPRRISAADFFVDYLTTSLRPGEILTAIRIPKLGAGWSLALREVQPGGASLVDRRRGRPGQAQ